MKDYEKHLAAFESYLTLRSYSPATQDSYIKALKQFFRFREAQNFSGPLSQEDARNYILHRYA